MTGTLVDDFWNGLKIKSLRYEWFEKGCNIILIWSDLEFLSIPDWIYENNNFFSDSFNFF